MSDASGSRSGTTRRGRRSTTTGGTAAAGTSSSRTRSRAGGRTSPRPTRRSRSSRRRQRARARGGTGIWTRKLVGIADRVVAVDANRETLALNTDEAEHVVADVFEWRPEETFDVVFFSFWLSHVPEERFDDFWALVRAALDPGGRVFLVDSGPVERSTGRDRRAARSATLADGREFRIVKSTGGPTSCGALPARLRARPPGHHERPLPVRGRRLDDGGGTPRAGRRGGEERVRAVLELPRRRRRARARRPRLRGRERRERRVSRSGSAPSARRSRRRRARGCGRATSRRSRSLRRRAAAAASGSTSGASSASTSAAPTDGREYAADDLLPDTWDLPER